MGGEGSRGITRVGRTVIARLETQIWRLPAGSVGEGLRKGKMASASTSFWEKAAFPALALMPDNSFPPHMSLVPFELLPQCWSSEGVSSSMSVCGPLRGIAWDSRSPPSHLATIPSGFHSQKLQGPIFLALEPRVGGPGVGLGSLAPEIFLLIFIQHM